MTNKPGPQGSSDKSPPTHSSAGGNPPRHAENDKPKKPEPKSPEDQQRQSREAQAGKAGESQKSQIAQYFKSQGRQPDDVVWEMQGMKLRLKDLE
jgi:hypothetical protein